MHKQIRANHFHWPIIPVMTNIDSDFSLDFNAPNWQLQPRTREYWTKNVDGSNQSPLNYFKLPNSPEHLELSQSRRTIVAKCNFSIDGSMMLGAVGFDNVSDDTDRMSINLGLIRFRQ